MTRGDFVVSVRNATVYVDGHQASEQKADDEAAWAVAHSLLRRYGTSISILVKPSRTERKEIRHWYVQPPDDEGFHVVARSSTVAKDLARVRLGRKKLPKGTTIHEEI